MAEPIIVATNVPRHFDTRVEGFKAHAVATVREAGLKRIAWIERERMQAPGNTYNILALSLKPFVVDIEFSVAGRTYSSLRAWTDEKVHQMFPGEDVEYIYDLMGNGVMPWDTPEIGVMQYLGATTESIESLIKLMRDFGGKEDTESLRQSSKIKTAIKMGNRSLPIFMMEMMPGLDSHGRGFIDFLHASTSAFLSALKALKELNDLFGKIVETTPDDEEIISRLTHQTKAWTRSWMGRQPRMVVNEEEQYIVDPRGIYDAVNATCPSITFDVGSAPRRIEFYARR